VRGFLKRFKPLNLNSKYALITTYIAPELLALEKMDKLSWKEKVLKKLLMTSAQG
jgi:hypothetical protein